MRRFGRHAGPVSAVAAASDGRILDTDVAALLARLDSTATGLTSTEAAARLRRHGPNTLMARGDPSRFTVLGRQLASPLLLLLLFAAAASACSPVNGSMRRWS